MSNITVYGYSAKAARTKWTKEHVYLNQKSENFLQHTKILKTELCTTTTKCDNAAVTDFVKSYNSKTDWNGVIFKTAYKIHYHLTLQYFNGKHGLILDVAYNIVSYKDMYSSGSLHIYVMYLIGGNAHQLSQFASHFSARQTVQVKGMIYWALLHTQIKGQAWSNGPEKQALQVNPLKPKLTYIIFKNIVLTSKFRQCITNWKIKWLMMFVLRIPQNL